MNDNIDPFSSTPAPVPQALQVDLAQYDSDYEKAEAAERESVPDGKYQCRINGVRLNKSQSGNPMLQYDLVVITGSYEGRHIFKNSMLTPAAMPYFKAELKTLGIQLAKLSDLSGRLESFLDLKVEVTSKTKPDQERPNVYINRCLQIPAGETPSKEPIPF